YWRFGDYLGIGAGAHGKLTRRDGRLWRSAKRRNPRSYQELANSDQRLDSAEAIADDQRLFEFMLNALRLREGVPAGLLRERTGLDPAQQPAIADARAKGLLVDDPGRLQASELGWRYLNDLQGMFLS
ncbi:MAG: oxygen-independent coproporphyrinogen III oxidase-like protein, partial [Xanthomonadales bacterium]|nr:oxygen-independent coproporphyrinogen III oxidase-like protein [Xanthomonadales bacterium]